MDDIFQHQRVSVSPPTLSLDDCVQKLIGQSNTIQCANYLISESIH